MFFSKIYEFNCKIGIQPYSCRQVLVLERLVIHLIYDCIGSRKRLTSPISIGFHVAFAVTTVIVTVSSTPSFDVEVHQGSIPIFAIFVATLHCFCLSAWWLLVKGSITFLSILVHHKRGWKGIYFLDTSYHKTIST